MHIFFVETHLYIISYSGFMTNPDWTYNLLRSESVLESLRTTSLRRFADLGRKYFESTSFGSLATMVSDEDLDSTQTTPKLYNNVATCVLVNFCEGAVIGGSLAVVVSVLPPLVKGRIQKLASNAMTRNNAKIALFLGLFMAIHNAGIHLERGKGKKQRRILRLLSMLFSGSAITILPARLRSFMVYLLFTRALEVAARKYRLGKADKPGQELISSHESVALTMASMSVITTTWFGWPHLVSKSYLHFLDNISNIRGEYFRKLGKVLLLRDVNEDAHLRFVVNKKKPCLAFHDETQPCAPFIGRVFVESLITKTIPFYGKLYVIPFALSLLRGRLSSKLVASTANRLWWSGLFLGVLDTLVGATICSISNQNIVPHILIMPLSGAVSGLSLYIEQPSRRLELALYMFGQAIQMLVSAYKYNGLWVPRNVDIVVCACSAALLTDAFSLQQELDEVEGPIVLRPTYNTLLGKILDTGSRRHAFTLPRLGA
jgi:hypothetical protein